MGLRDRLSATRVVPLYSKTSSNPAHDSQTLPSLDLLFGMNAGVKTCYEGLGSIPGSYIWVNKPPKQVSSSVAKECDGMAIKVFKIKDRENPCIGGIFPLKYHPVDVQNLVLVESLKPIFREKIGSRLDTEYTEPLQDLWFYQEEIANLAMTAEKADALKPYLQLLLTTMNEIFAGLRFANKKIQQIGLVDFKSAWTLFPRDCPVYSFGLNVDIVGYHKYHSTKGLREYNDPSIEEEATTYYAEILENENFMPERRGSGVRVRTSWRVCIEEYKFWMNFYPKDIEPMVWNDKAYEHLVYDPQQKDLVLSFVESHGRASTLQRYVMTLEGMESSIKVTNPQAGKRGSEDDNGGLYG
ncbi:AAA family ATPase [Metarhizium brunneum]